MKARLLHLCNDLRFIIGLFLMTIGAIVLMTYAFGSHETVNAIGGGMLALVGLGMLTSGARHCD